MASSSENSRTQFQSPNTYMTIEEQTEPVDFSTSQARPVVRMPVLSSAQSLNPGQHCATLNSSQSFKSVHYSTSSLTSFSHQLTKPFSTTQQVINASEIATPVSTQYAICVASSRQEATCFVPQSNQTFQNMPKIQGIEQTPVATSSNQIFSASIKPALVPQQPCLNSNIGNNCVAIISNATTKTTDANTMAQNQQPMNHTGGGSVASNVVPISGSFQVTSTLLVPSNKVVSLAKMEPDGRIEPEKTLSALMQLSPRYIATQALCPTVVEVSQANVPLLQLPQNTVYMTSQLANTVLKPTNEPLPPQMMQSKFDQGQSQVTINYPLKPQTPSCALQKGPTICQLSSPSSIGHHVTAIKSELVDNGLTADAPLPSYQHVTHQQLSTSTSDASANSRQSSPMQMYSPSINSSPYTSTCLQNSVTNSMEQDAATTTYSTGTISASSPNELDPLVLSSLNLKEYYHKKNVFLFRKIFYICAYFMNSYLYLCVCHHVVGLNS